MLICWGVFAIDGIINIIKIPSTQINSNHFNKSYFLIVITMVIFCLYIYLT